MFIKRYSLLNNLIVFLPPTSHAAIGLALKQVFVEEPRTQLYCWDVFTSPGAAPSSPLGQPALVYPKRIWRDQHLAGPLANLGRAQGSCGSRAPVGISTKLNTRRARLQQQTAEALRMQLLCLHTTLNIRIFFDDK